MPYMEQPVPYMEQPVPYMEQPVPYKEQPVEQPSYVPGSSRAERMAEQSR